MGLKVPPLGSPEDIVYRQFLSRKNASEVKKTKLLALIASASGDSEASWNAKITKTLQEYSNSVFGIESVEDTEEVKMREEYEKVKTQTPKLYVDEDGNPAVVGIE